MKKKKIISTLAAVAVVGSLAIGSLAWFTSSDSVTNAFSTGGTNNARSVDSGIEINEKFDPEEAKDILPGEVVQKLVKVDSTAKYDQVVRAQISKEFKNAAGQIVDCYTIEEGKNAKDGKEERQITFYKSGDAKTPKGAIMLNKDYIELNLTANSKWTDMQSDDYYYYTEVLPGGQTTSAILDSVTLSKDADNVYKNLSFDVVVNAESIQASNGAAADAWKGAPQQVKELGK